MRPHLLPGLALVLAAGSCLACDSSPSGPSGAAPGSADPWAGNAAPAPQPPPADPWATGAAPATADPWAGDTPPGPAPDTATRPRDPGPRGPARAAAAEPPAAADAGPLVGEWFQGSAGMDVLDAGTGTWRAATGSAETWAFGTDGRYAHSTFRLSRLGSCTRRFLTTRVGRYRASGDVVTLTDQTSRIRAVSDCGAGYEQAAPPDPSPVRVSIEPDGTLLSIANGAGEVIADRFARRR